MYPVCIPLDWSTVSFLYNSWMTAAGECVCLPNILHDLQCATAGWSVAQQSFCMTCHSWMRMPVNDLCSVNFLDSVLSCSFFSLKSYFSQSICKCSQVIRVELKFVLFLFITKRQKWSAKNKLQNNKVCTSTYRMMVTCIMLQVLIITCTTLLTR